MRRWSLIFALCCAAAGADEFSDRLEQGNELLRRGDAAGALALFRELQVEEPNSPELLFSLGCANYQEAVREDTPRNPEETAALLEEARDAFERAEALAEDRRRADAGYNHANTLAQAAKRSASKDPQEREKAYERSIRAYEQFLKRHPAHPQAAHNLDHMRYMLKRAQQAPPPPPPPQGEPQDPQQDGDRQQQSQGQGQQNQDPQQEQKPSEGDRESQEKQENRQDGQESQQPPQETQDAPPQLQQKAEIGKTPDRQSVEALLKSLENVDLDEQKRLRNAPHGSHIPQEWW